MIERETNNTVVTEGSGDSGNPMAAILIIALLVIGGILLYNYYGRGTANTTDDTNDRSSTEINIDTNDANNDGATSPATTAPTSTAAPTTQTTQ